METQAKYLTVGICTILACLLFAGFLVFSSSKDRKTSQYVVHFKGGVWGLSIGNSVLFNGVQVGTVKGIGFVATDQSQVRVVLEISSDVVIRHDCVAVLTSQGITGTSTIYITGGSPSSPPLTTGAEDDDEHLPVIPVGKSALESFADGIPNLVKSAKQLTDRVNEIFTEKNTEQFQTILKATAKITTDLAEGDNSLQATLESLKTASDQMALLLTNADTLLNNDARKTVLSIKESFERLNGLMAGLEPTLQRLSVNDSVELSLLLNDTRRLVQELNQIARDLNVNPKGLLFGPGVPEYRLHQEQ